MQRGSLAPRPSTVRHLPSRAVQEGTIPLGKELSDDELALAYMRDWLVRARCRAGNESQPATDWSRASANDVCTYFSFCYEHIVAAVA